MASQVPGDDAEEIRTLSKKLKQAVADDNAKEPQPEPETLTMHELARSDDPAEDVDHRIYHDAIRDIHADWLMTPCAELNDQLPRTVCQ